jgi:hypothetical protein
MAVAAEAAASYVQPKAERLVMDVAGSKASDFKSFAAARAAARRFFCVCCGDDAWR